MDDRQSLQVVVSVDLNYIFAEQLFVNTAEVSFPFHLVNSRHSDSIQTIELLDSVLNAFDLF